MLYPDLLVGLKFLCDNKRQVDIENETLKNSIRGQAETTVHLYVGHRLDPPTDVSSCVLKTEDKIEEPVVSSEVFEKDNGDVNEVVELAASDLQDSQMKENLGKFCGTYRDVFAVRMTHFVDTKDKPAFQICSIQCCPIRIACGSG